jgi:hypothetical protein
MTALVVIRHTLTLDVPDVVDIAKMDDDSSKRKKSVGGGRTEKEQLQHNKKRAAGKAKTAVGVVPEIVEILDVSSDDQDEPDEDQAKKVEKYAWFDAALIGLNSLYFFFSHFWFNFLFAFCASLASTAALL